MSTKTVINRRDIMELLAEKQQKCDDTWIIKDGRLHKNISKKTKNIDKPPPLEEHQILTKSYIHGPPNHTMVYKTLPEILEKRSLEQPDDEAHVFWTMRDESRLQRESISFSVLSERSAILAGNFLEMGLEAGDRIAIIGDNCPDWVYVEYAALRSGICLVRLHSGLVTADSVRRVVFQQQCRAMIVSPGDDDVVLKKVIKVIPGVKSVDDLLTTLPNMRLMTMGEPNHDTPIKSIQELIVTSSKVEEVVKIQDGLDPHDMAVAYSTSGSSSFPKFVGITHFSYINNVLAFDDMKLEDSKSRFFNDRPFTWIGSGLHSSVVLGVTIVHMDSVVTNSPEHTKMVLSIMEEEKVTVSMAINTIFNQCQEDSTGSLKFPQSVQCILSGGETLSNDSLAFCRDNFEATCLMYASSETFMVAKRVMSGYEGASDNPYRQKPLPHVEMKVTDDDEKILPVGTPGRLWVRSPYLFKSYLNFEKKSKVIFHTSGGRGQGLWFNTDDSAVIYEDGTVQVIGREDDIITRDDVSIYPYSYESIMRKYPKVQDVYIFGVPDKELGAEIGICVSFKEGFWVSEDAVHEYYERSGLDPLPEYYHVSEEFPRLPNGKMDRKSLDAMLAEKFCDGEEDD